MSDPIECKSVEANQLAASYLAGALGQAEAEAFEQHYLDCDRCWNQVRTASELRASLGRPAVVPVDSRSNWPVWSLVAAAALVAVATLGIWQLARTLVLPPTAPVLRGSATDALTITTSRLSNGQLQLSWTPDAEAQTYRVELLRSDGIPVWQRETSQTTFSFEAGTLPALPDGVSFVARVEAVDPLGRVVARGANVPLFGR